MKFSLDFKASLVLSYVSVLRIPVAPIPIPAPFNSAFVVTVEAIPTLKSANSIRVESTISS